MKLTDSREVLPGAGDALHLGLALEVTLISTLLLTGLSTFAVGFVPGYDTIGIWGAVILTVVRFIQGVGLGGEWGGATLIAMEWAKTNAHRGFITSWPQWGGPAGLFLANIMVLIFSAISGDQFLTWGWRVPFWLSIVMVAIGIYIRLGILETPVFQRILDMQQVARAPVLEVIRRQPKEIILTALCRMAEQAPVLCLCRIHLHLRHDGAAQFARPAVDRADDRHRPVGGHDPAGRPHLRPHRAQADVPDRRRHDGTFRLRLFRDAEHDDPGGDLPRHHAVVHPARHDVRAAGGADRRVLQRRGCATAAPRSATICRR